MQFVILFYIKKIIQTWETVKAKIVYQNFENSLGFSPGQILRPYKVIERTKHNLSLTP
jgi:hypothetical protein